MTQNALYIIATPIGNHKDITLRALEQLGKVDAIFCEDTRHSAKLLALHGISVPLFSYHEHSPPKVRAGIVKRLERGESLALISDGGTPLISDPGFKLIREVRGAGFDVVPIPGVSAPIAALSVAGMPCHQFFFAGFLPPKKTARKKALLELAAIPASLVFFEAPQRLCASLADMEEVLGARPLALCRELTKKFEEIMQGTPAEISKKYEDEPPKGEITLIVAAPRVGAELSDEEIMVLLGEAVKHKSKKSAISEIARLHGVARSRVYALALKLS